MENIKTLEIATLEYVMEAYKTCGGNQSLTARKLNVSVRTIHNMKRRAKDLGIEAKVDPCNPEYKKKPGSKGNGEIILRCFATNDERLHYVDNMPNKGNAFYSGKYSQQQPEV